MEVVECAKCKNVKSVSEFYKDKNNVNRYYTKSYCKTCWQKHTQDRRADGKRIITDLLKSCQSSAKKRLKAGRIECGICSITKDDILMLKEKQENRCALTGVELIWKPNSGWKKVSIDRIDNDKGYMPENVRLVAWGINQALSDYGIDIFDEMCRARLDFIN